MTRSVVSICAGFFVALVILGLVAFYTLRASYRSQDRIITIVVPDGFEGVIRISEGAGGVDVFEEDGVVTLNVGESGRVVAATLDPFYDWYTLQAEYANGDALPVLTDVTMPDRVALRQLFNTEDTVFFVVGNGDDWNTANEAGP